jgi:hypothetical protein
MTNEKWPVASDWCLGHKFHATFCSKRDSGHAPSLLADAARTESAPMMGGADELTHLFQKSLARGPLGPFPADPTASRTVFASPKYHGR